MSGVYNLQSLKTVYTCGNIGCSLYHKTSEICAGTTENREWGVFVDDKTKNFKL